MTLNWVQILPVQKAHCVWGYFFHLCFFTATMDSDSLLVGLFQITGPHHSPLLKELVRAETQAETVEECCLLAGYTWLAQPDFLYNGGALPGLIPPTMGEALPYQSPVKKIPHRIPHWPLFLS